MMGQWKGIEEFMAVVETGSFSKAAERMNVSVSHISKRVNELEKSLKTQLLERSTRKVNPTTQAKLFYQSCRQLLTDFSHACDNLQQDKETLTGQLKICTVGGSRPAFQVDLYRIFLDKYPELSIEATYSDHIPSLTEEGLDLVLVVGKVDSASVQSSFHLCWVDYVLVVSPALLGTFPLPTEPADCSSLPCILNGEDHWRLSNGKTSVVVAVNGRFASPNMPACIDACINGIGIFMVPTYCIDGMVADGRLVRLLPDWHIRKSLYALLPSKEHVPAKVIRMMEFMDQTMGSDTGDAGRFRQLLTEKHGNTMQILRDMNNGVHKAEANVLKNRSR